MRKLNSLLILLAFIGFAYAQQATYTQDMRVTSGVVRSTFDLSLATGQVQNLSLSFTPSSCTGFGSVSGGTAATQITYGGHSDSAAVQTTFAYGSAINIATTNSKFFSVIDAGGTNYQQAVISYGTNQVTLTWAKTGTPTGTFSYSLLCFK